MRPLAYLVLSLLPFGVACASPDTDYPSYSQASGPRSGSDSTSEDAGSQATQAGQPPSSSQPPGSTPSPVWHDAGSWQPDANVVVVVPLPPSNPSYDAGTPVATTPPTGDDAGSPYAAVLAQCAGGINALRGQNDLFQLTISASLESLAAQTAASNAQSGQNGFGGGGNNGFGGEDDFDGERIDPGASAEQVLTQGLLDEEEGELNGENNLLDQRFSQVGCGVAQTSDGSYWITIEYE
jgi:uncharacterized protein YkwD